jgi:hypothetical protein
MRQKFAMITSVARLTDATLQPGCAFIQQPAVMTEISAPLTNVSTEFACIQRKIAATMMNVQRMYATLPQACAPRPHPLIAMTEIPAQRTSA